MQRTIQFVVLPIIAVAGGVEAQALQYLTVEGAQAALFPGAKLETTPLRLTDAQRKAVEKLAGSKLRSPDVRAWRVSGGGWFFVEDVIGKHEFITFALALDDAGTVKGLEVMDYRENYGGEVRGAEWRRQFIGKKTDGLSKLEDEIRQVSGATLSCRHVTAGVKRLLAVHALVLAK